MTQGDTPDLSTTAGRLADLRDRYHEAVTAAGEAAIAKQHAKGKGTARERIEQLLDDNSFVEFDEFVRHRTTAFGKRTPKAQADDPFVQEQLKQLGDRQKVLQDMLHKIATQLNQ